MDYYGTSFAEVDGYARENHPETYRFLIQAAHGVEIKTAPCNTQFLDSTEGTTMLEHYIKVGFVYSSLHRANPEIDPPALYLSMPKEDHSESYFLTCAGASYSNEIDVSKSDVEWVYPFRELMMTTNNRYVQKRRFDTLSTYVWLAKGYMECSRIWSDDLYGIIGHLCTELFQISEFGSHQLTRNQSVSQTQDVSQKSNGVSGKNKRTPKTDIEEMKRNFDALSGQLDSIDKGLKLAKGQIELIRKELWGA